MTKTEKQEINSTERVVSEEAAGPKTRRVYYDGIYPEAIITDVGQVTRAAKGAQPRIFELEAGLAAHVVKNKGFKFAK